MYILYNYIYIWYCGWLRNPASVDRWFISLSHYLNMVSTCFNHPKLVVYRISQPSTVSMSTVPWAVRQVRSMLMVHQLRLRSGTVVVYVYPKNEAGWTPSLLTFTELDDGKIYRKPLYLMVKTMVPLDFPLNQSIETLKDGTNEDPMELGKNRGTFDVFWTNPLWSLVLRFWEKSHRSKGNWRGLIWWWEWCWGDFNHLSIFFTTVYPFVVKWHVQFLAMVEWGFWIVSKMQHDRNWVVPGVMAC